MPRWRRPSLLQARKADPLRANATAPRLAFDQGFNGSLAGTERRLIRYTVVRLLDAPDELRGREIGDSSARATRSSCSRSRASTGSWAAPTAVAAGSTR